MKVKVGKNGITIRRDMLGGVDEVEVRKENGRFVIEPVRSSGEDGEDPILGLGRAPRPCGTPDASENHDRYLYDR